MCITCSHVPSGSLLVFLLVQWEHWGSLGRRPEKTKWLSLSTLSSISSLCLILVSETNLAVLGDYSHQCSRDHMMPQIECGTRACKACVTALSTISPAQETPFTLLPGLWACADPRARGRTVHLCRTSHMRSGSGIKQSRAGFDLRWAVSATRVRSHQVGYLEVTGQDGVNTGALWHS